MDKLNLGPRRETLKKISELAGLSFLAAIAGHGEAVATPQLGGLNGPNGEKVMESCITLPLECVGIMLNKKNKETVWINLKAVETKSSTFATFKDILDAIKKTSPLSEIESFVYEHSHPTGTHPVPSITDLSVVYNNSLKHYLHSQGMENVTVVHRLVSAQGRFETKLLPFNHLTPDIVKTREEVLIENVEIKKNSTGITYAHQYQHPTTKEYLATSNALMELNPKNSKEVGELIRKIVTIGRKMGFQISYKALTKSSGFDTLVLRDGTVVINKQIPSPKKN